MSIEDLFKHSNALPPAPKVVEDLIRSFSEESISVTDIANKLSTDPVLSAKLLRLANSVYYRATRTVGTINEAVVMLGFVTVRTLVISSGLVEGFKPPPGMDLKQFWRVSLNTAVGAKWLAQHLDQNSELAFTVGMTHAIGQLIIHTALPEQARALDKRVGIFDDGRPAAEQEALGFDYAQASAELAARWKFPEDFSAALLAFPRPLKQQPFNKMAALIHLAAWHARMEEIQPADYRASYPNEIAAALGMTPYYTLEHMPHLSELGEGLQELFA
jgi:HD-like signal output (HDOD) protein